MKDPEGFWKKIDTKIIFVSIFFQGSGQGLAFKDKGTRLNIPG